MERCNTWAWTSGTSCKRSASTSPFHSSSRAIRSRFFRFWNFHRPRVIDGCEQDHCKDVHPSGMAEKLEEATVLPDLDFSV